MKLQKKKKKKYLTIEQYNDAKKSFKIIIKKKKINNKKLAELEKNVLESSILIFSFLKEDLKIFNNENLNQANIALRKLNLLLQD